MRVCIALARLSDTHIRHTLRICFNMPHTICLYACCIVSQYNNSEREICECVCGVLAYRRLSSMALLSAAERQLTKRARNAGRTTHIISPECFAACDVRVPSTNDIRDCALHICAYARLRLLNIITPSSSSSFDSMTKRCGCGDGGGVHVEVFFVMRAECVGTLT